ncbi:MAG: polysaccharide deacetylase [Desulfobacterales bacterium]|nr:MAG: polysaccharide deacetylase [Desulfobacterales bacterium]
MNQQPVQNYLTIDVEEHFQVSAFEDIIPTSNWHNYESRVAGNTRKILSILNEYNTKATFFVVGWVAEKHPELVKAIQKEGHEIGCHSYAHRKIYDLTPEIFEEDTRKAKNILEDITGEKIRGYRAPSYSITSKSLWALDILEKLGFEYDSSIFPTYHDNYGIPDAPRFEYYHEKHNLKEYPVSTIRILRKNLPVAGGGYFRLYPYWFTRAGLNSINQKEKRPFMFYLHPWEIDPAQPRFQNARFFSRFRHYNNLSKTSGRFKRLLKEFSFTSISDRKNQ